MEWWQQQEICHRVYETQHLVPALMGHSDEKYLVNGQLRGWIGL
jgi:hypothetical protein